MIQGSLFKNSLPQLDQNIREKNKMIREKTKSKTTTSGPTTVRGMNKISQAIQLMRQTVESKLGHEKDLYGLIRKEEDLVEYVDQIIEKGIAAIDTETRGLDPIEDRLVGTCLYAPGLKGTYIPHEHTDLSDKVLPDQIPFDIMAREMNRMIKAGVKFVLHNAKFDLRVIKNWLGVWFVPHWDTLIASNFLNENEPHGLKALHDKYIVGNTEEDKELNTFNTLFGGIPFNYVPIDMAYLYAGKDPVMTFEVYDFQLPFLTPDNEACQRQALEDAAKLYMETEVPLIPFLAEMEEEGVAIDDSIAKELSEEFTVKMREAAEAANKLLKQLDYSVIPPSKRDKLGGTIEIGEGTMDVVVNIGSSTQLAIVLYDMLELKSPDKEKPRGTGEDIISAIAEKADEGSMVKKLVNHILDFRGAKKLISTYVDKLPRVVKQKTGRLHGSFNQYGAKTGRFSSSDPNLQNIPARGAGKRVRTMFSAGPGKVLIGSDFSYLKVG